MLRSLSAGLFSLSVAVSVGAPAFPASAQDRDNKGTEFVLGFMENLGTSYNVLFITGDTATSGTVEIPGLGFVADFTVAPGTVTTVNLPSTTVVSGSDVTVDRGVLVTADNEVAVHGLNQVRVSADAFLGLPSDILGTDHIVLGRNESLSTRAFPPNLGPSEFLVVGVADNTTVTITPAVDTGSRVAGVPYDIVLDRLEAYQLQTDDALEDLSGSLVTSDNPVAVFAGGVCIEVPDEVTGCDHLVEQIPSTDTWGTEFLTESLATRTGGDLFRILARDDGTDVFLDDVYMATINRGEFHEVDLASGTQHEIETTGPALVMQYSKGPAADGTPAGPFMMMIPPTEQFLDGYTLFTPFTMPSTSDKFINVIVPTGDIPYCTIDGGPFSGPFNPVGASGFSAAQQPVSFGSHALSCPNPFGAYSYGFANEVSYGYTGGLALAPIAVNQPPVADAGPDQVAECSSPLGAQVAPDGSGSFDPDGHPLTFTWTDSFGSVMGQTAMMTLAFGMETVTLTVDDGHGGTDIDTVDIIVEDTTAPAITATLTPVGDSDGDDDEGRFLINFFASDVCVPASTVTAVLVVPGVADIPVVDGQIIEFEVEDDETDIEAEDGDLEIEASSLTLQVTATDASGNTATAEAQLAGRGEDEDNDEDEDEDEDTVAFADEDD